MARRKNANRASSRSLRFCFYEIRSRIIYSERLIYQVNSVSFFFVLFIRCILIALWKYPKSTTRNLNLLYKAHNDSSDEVAMEKNWYHLVDRVVMRWGMVMASNNVRNVFFEKKKTMQKLKKKLPLFIDWACGV